MTENKISDQSQRERALNPGHSFIVQAPAGSGKTGLLVRRFLTLLARVREPEEIVAITFTRKATAEMRKRILDALIGAREHLDNGIDPEDEVLDLAVRALRNGRERDWNLIENPRRLWVSSIDAFALELVRRMPWSSRFGGIPQIVEGISAEEFYNLAARRTLEHIDTDSKWAPHSGNLLSLADANLALATRLLVDMLKKRDQWMRGISHDRKRVFETMWQEMICEQLQQTRGRLPEPLQRELIEMLGFAAEHIDPKPATQAIADCTDIKEFPDSSVSALPAWRGLATLILTKGGPRRKRVDKNTGFPTDQKSRKNRMVELLGELDDHPYFLRELHITSTLPAGKFSELQWCTLDSILKLLPVAAAELRLIFSESNSADYSEISQRAEVALGDTDNPSEVALFADYRIGHILMDEVQDSSRAQFDLLANLVREWTPGDGRTLFLVGDPMQSIYRFRQAEVGNFLKIQHEGIASIKPEPLTLESNFRSSENLVDWCNQTLQPVFPVTDDVVNSAIAYSPSTAIQGETEGSNVELHFQWNEPIESEAREVSKQVALEIARDNQTSIGILGRTRRHLGYIANALYDDGVSYQAIELEPLSRRPAILDLMSLTRAMINANDRIAWLSILRAPWCGMGLNDLTRLTAGDERLIPRLIEDSEVVTTLSADGQRRLARFAEIMIPAMERINTVQLRRLIYGIWIGLGGPACIGEDDRLDCESYFELLAKLESEHESINAGLLKQAVEQYWSKSSAQANVQLLTIHNAKGLEFDVVMLPMLNRRGKNDDNPMVRWIRLPEQLLIAALPHSHEEDGSFYQYLKDLEKQRQTNEMCRLLYVACTRARHRLHLFANLKTTAKGVSNPNAGSMWKLLAPVLETQIPIPPETPNDLDKPLAETDPAQPFYRLPLDFSGLRLPVDVKCDTNLLATDRVSHVEQIEYSWAGESARVLGIALHQILQFVTPDRWQTWKTTSSDQIGQAARNVLSAHGLDPVQHPHITANLTRAIENIQNDGRAEWIFSTEHEDVQIEWPLVADLDGEIVSITIDRSFIDSDGIRWIVDFKFSEHQGDNLAGFLDNEQLRYTGQMQRYARIVRLLEDRPVKTGLYFPLHRGWREWQP